MSPMIYDFAPVFPARSTMEVPLADARRVQISVPTATVRRSRPRVPMPFCDGNRHAAQTGRAQGPCCTYTRTGAWRGNAPRARSPSHATRLLPDDFKFPVQDPLSDDLLVELAHTGLGNLRDQGDGVRQPEAGKLRRQMPAHVLQ